MDLGTRVKLKPLFVFDEDKVQRYGHVVHITGSFLVVLVEGLPDHISPYCVKRPWDLEVIDK